MNIPLTVVAKNEERAIGRCLDSLLAAKRFAEERVPLSLDLKVVLDDCCDNTEAVASAKGVPCVHSTGGKVEAQRRALRDAPFHIFCDADVEVREDTLCALCEAILGDAKLLVAFPPKQPLPHRRRTPLSWALHVYNARCGFSSQRTWFSGKLFAIRRWEMPTLAEVKERARYLPASRFYQYDLGLRADDIYLSHRTLLEGGPASLTETRAGLVLFRAPETLRGMYQYYRRLRKELERFEALFPELRDVHRQYGTRVADLLAQASVSERFAWAIFHTALFGCRIGYRLERIYFEWLSQASPESWPPIAETKEL